jgi:PilZ domain-containing protein
VKTPGDRRKGARLEVVGPLWGTFHLSVPVRVVDASALGVLIASPIRFPPDSIQQLCLNVGDDQFRIEARVCHVRSGDQRYAGQDLIGLEFLPSASDLSP